VHNAIAPLSAIEIPVTRRGAERARTGPGEERLGRPPSAIHRNIDQSSIRKGLRQNPDTPAAIAAARISPSGGAEIIRDAANALR
jgi:hypothetical protein